MSQRTLITLAFIAGIFLGWFPTLMWASYHRQVDQDQLRQAHETIGHLLADKANRKEYFK